jgi:hypothetical protein
MKVMRWVAVGLFVVLGILALFVPTTGRSFVKLPDEPKT